MQNKKQNGEVKEYVRCEDLFRDAVPNFDPGEICRKLREVATGSELTRLKHTVIDMLRRCEQKDEFACKFYKKLLSAPAWRVESLVKEYMQYLKYLDCMRSYNDEKMCRRHIPHGEKSQKRGQNIEENLQKLPVDYVREEDVIVVRVGKGERLPEPQFKATISELKKLGFEFDPETKLWYIHV
jgi:hypothetical protein